MKKEDLIQCSNCGLKNRPRPTCIKCGTPLHETKKPEPLLPKQEAPKQEAPKQEAPKQEAPKQEAPKQKPKTVNLPKITHENYTNYDLYKELGLDYPDDSSRVVEGPSQKEIDVALKDLRVLTAKTEHFQTFTTLNDLLKLPANRKLYNIERFIHKMYPKCKRLNITSVKKIASSILESEGNHLPTKTQVKDKIDKRYWKEDHFLESVCEDKKKKFKKRKPGEKKKSGCFIATAAYGTGMEIDVLRTWRDDSLLPHRTGQILVECYYTVGYPVSRVIEKSEILKSVTRLLLRPIIRGAKFSINRRNKNDL